jgi:ATP-dependent DNA helicase RecG
VDKIHELIALGEGYHIEFKVKIDKSIASEICAFANADGGALLIGVTDSGEIKPLSLDNELMSRIQDTINQIEPKIRVKFHKYPEIGVLLVEVEKGINRPYACSDGFFLRMGPNSQKLTRNEIIDLFQSEGLIQFDKLEHHKADFLNDFDRFAYNNFLNKTGITNQIEPEHLLKNLGCMSDSGKFTNAGVLFFTKSIDFLLKHAECTCVLFKGTGRVTILDRKDYNTNMLDNIDNAVNFVKRHTNLAYKIESIQREDIPDIPEIALREAVINAFCHRNYFQEGANIMVEVFDDRVVVVSPGGLPSGLSKQEFGIKSVRRNHLIADLLARTRYIEKAGTGIERIKKDAANHDCKLEISYDENWFTVTFYRSRVDKTTSPDVDFKIAPVNEEKYPANEEIAPVNAEIAPVNAEIAPVNSLQEYLKEQNKFKLSQRKIQKLLEIVAYVKDSQYNRQKLSEDMKLSFETIRNYTETLVNLDLIEFVGAAKNGYYQVTDKLKQIEITS